MIVTEQSGAQRREGMITCESGGKFLDWVFLSSLYAGFPSIGTGVVLWFRCRPRRSAVSSLTKKPCTAVFFAPSALVFDRS